MGFSAPAFAEQIIFTNGVPVWYSYNCATSIPSVYTVDSPEVTRFSYYSHYSAGSCHAVLNAYNLEDLEDFTNGTALSMHLHTKGRLINDNDLSSNYTRNCNLLYFPDFDTVGNNINETPDNLGSFLCAYTNSTVLKNEIAFSNSTITGIENKLAAGNFTFAFLVLPNYTGSFLTDLDNDGYSFGISKYKMGFELNGDGFYCFLIRSSNLCNFLDDPWGALKHTLGEDYIGEWFYVIVWFPLPIAIFLMTRNGTYAGFMGLGIMLVIQTIDPVVFEIALTMALMAAAFAFYDVFRNRILGGMG